MSMDSKSRKLSHEENIGASSLDDQQESGWTVYFEDFITNNFSVEDDQKESSSLVSDATSSAAKKLVEEKTQVTRLSPDQSCRKQFCFKKCRKAPTLALFDDDAFEDTASSPVSSPKVSDLKPLHVDSKGKENLDHYEEKESACGKTEKRSELGIIEGDCDISELKKRGLCLMPMSMLASYLD